MHEKLQTPERLLTTCTLLCLQRAAWRRRCRLLCPTCCSTRRRSLSRRTWSITERRWDGTASPERSVPAAGSRCLRGSSVNNTALRGCVTEAGRPAALRLRCLLLYTLDASATHAWQRRPLKVCVSLVLLPTQILLHHSYFGSNFLLGLVLF